MSSRVQFAENFLAKRLALSLEDVNTSSPLKRGGIEDLSLSDTLFSKNLVIQYNERQSNDELHQHSWIWPLQEHSVRNKSWKADFLSKIWRHSKIMTKYAGSIRRMGMD